MGGCPLLSDQLLLVLRFLSFSDLLARTPTSALEGVVRVAISCVMRDIICFSRFISCIHWQWSDNWGAESPGGEDGGEQVVVGGTECDCVGSTSASVSGLLSRLFGTCDGWLVG